MYNVQGQHVTCMWLDKKAGAICATPYGQSPVCTVVEEMSRWW